MLFTRHQSCEPTTTLALRMLRECGQSIINYQASIINRQSLVINRQLSIVNHEPSVVNHYTKLAPRLTKSIFAALRNPASPARAKSCGQVIQDSAKLVPKVVQKSVKNGVPHRPLPPRMGYSISPVWPKIGKKRANATMKSKGFDSLPPFLPKMAPTFPQRGAQNGAKLANKTIQESMFLLMPLGVDL